MKQYLLTENLFKKLSTRCNPLICYHCKNPLKINDKIVSSAPARPSKRYHKECYEKLFIDA